jgi:hypothetical protein
MSLNAYFTPLFCIFLVLAASASPSLASSSNPVQAHADGSAKGHITGTAGINTDVPVASPTPVVELQSKPDFSGLWILNTKASDDPQEKIKEAMKQARSAGRGVEGGSGGQGRGGGMGSGRQGRGSPEGMERRNKMPSGDMPSLIATAQKLDIAHKDPLLLITDENARRQSIFTDFRGASVSANGDLQQRVTIAGWEGTVLVVKTTLSSGTKLIQNFQIDAPKGQFMISTSAHLTEMQPAQFRLVYDQLKPEPEHGDH